VATAAAAGAIALIGVTGCAKMDAALNQQWITVNFNPGTSVATALQVRAACSHIKDTPPLALPAKHSVINMMYGVRYNTTNSSPANEAQLQSCLQKFKSVQGLDPENAGDEGD
jgi:carbamoylphosphate synthase large subunit